MGDMDTLLDPWNINPRDVVRQENARHSDDRGQGNTDNTNYDFASANTNDLMFPPNSDENIFDMNYYEIDKLLTEELQDLDIPMLPTNEEGNSDMNWMSSGNSNPQPQQQCGPRKSISHKRGLSGTANFGFANHNKTLSISSLQKNILNMSRDPAIMDTVNHQSHVESKPKGNNSEVNQLILKQQEELRLALERQREVNKKLEEQLKMNQLQQDQLQRVLQEQLATQQLISNSAATSPTKSLRTPVRLPENDAEAHALIVTSNSADGRYQFPPPMISPPTSTISVNGSPRKRSSNRDSSRNFLSIVDPKDHHGISPADSTLNAVNGDKEIPNIFQRLSSENKSGNTNLCPFLHAINSPGIDFSLNTPKQNGLFSSRAHNKKESTLSTVSTIPQQSEAGDSEYTHGYSSGLVGLGLQMGNKPDHLSRNVDVLPTIAASADNTPVKGQQPGNLQSSVPRKHVFHHTPVKQQPEFVINNCDTPLLSPPSALSHTRAEGLSPIRTPTSSPLRTVYGAGGDLEVSSQMPAPVEPHTGPIRITRKPTTLPRGCIDQYVKELPDRMFACLYPNCDKTFKRRYNVRSHIQTHLQDRPYTCDYPGCEKAFVRNHDLVRHKKGHTGKTFTCPSCNKRYVDQDRLERHRSKATCGGSVTKRTASPNKYTTSPSKLASPTKDHRDQAHEDYVASRLEREFAGRPDSHNSEDSENLITELFGNSSSEHNSNNNASMMLTPSPPSGLSDME
ncbi:DNA-binding transcription factor ACE2 KNAG_0G02470 [Huiozyma naganishii CBS 8797]|uniref:C2H2-type domain-containing protein n=1 Tax=Huiozyma naganishii (strain ATCC MYA-139 / BCRC 22969 / CBS 8797 / KCTC 17520 / NBRC 10181 / NCYC 3082 / Yp74L-3) TaxID=1071383 RepID=J7S822_HUIN7|nr:hypothetical protein KNAG_0G02470 [Kazachstania naganishii CBS 8797]CCK71304.1 hypothetical protein KNAG_0G02470 [Kazachstania naganishii CBS 8797]